MTIVATTARIGGHMLLDRLKLQDRGRVFTLTGESYLALASRSA